MKKLHIDIETYSEEDLKKCGMYKYSQHPSFQVILIAYAFDDSPVKILDMTSQHEMTAEEVFDYDKVVEALTNPNVIKVAHNAAFERTCLAAAFLMDLPAEQWECTMIKAAYAGLPMALGSVASVLKLPVEKDLRGTGLIKYFCLPCRPTKTNGERTRNLPNHAPETWEAFKEYCVKDVEVEMAIDKHLSWLTISDFEKGLWALDQRINDRGILLDKRFVRNAIQIDTDYRAKLMEEAIRITGLDNPNSTSQLSRWFEQETGDSVETLKKADIPVMLQKYDDDLIQRVLRIRQELSKTSVKKYVAMAHAVCNDGRVRGLIQFYGANRTGRWAGRLVQVHNLPQNHLADLDLARTLVRDNDPEMLEMCYGNIPDTLSQLIRTSFVAGKDKILGVSDFSAIEARVLAWIAGEQWRLDVFNTHGKIYEASASAMFSVPLESVTKGSDLRQKGKVSELALGYQGGVGALVTMGALKMGLTEEELPELVSAWREANPAIVDFWNKVQKAAISALKGNPVRYKGLRFGVLRGAMYIELPSGRRLQYFNARLATNKWGGESIKYEGVDPDTKQWGWVDTYGGKLTENIVQAIARDCLAEALVKVDKAGFDLVMHVHDELIAVLDELTAETDLEIINGIMGEELPWAKGLPLKGDGYLTKYYKKD